MTSSLLVFCHGKESGPWGRKIRYLADVAASTPWQVVSIDFAAITGIPDAPAQARLEALQRSPPLSEPNTFARLVLVGSSMGGWVCAQAATTLQAQGLFLMAPALGLPHYPTQWPQIPSHTVVEVVHGWHDEVIPVNNAIEFAQRNHARLHLLDDGHELGNSLADLGLLFTAFLARMG